MVTKCCQHLSCVLHEVSSRRRRINNSMNSVYMMFVCEHVVCEDVAEVQVLMDASWVSSHVPQSRS